MPALLQALLLLCYYRWLLLASTVIHTISAIVVIDVHRTFMRSFPFSAASFYPLSLWADLASLLRLHSVPNRKSCHHCRLRHPRRAGIPVLLVPAFLLNSHTGGSGQNRHPYLYHGTYPRHTGGSSLFSTSPYQHLFYPGITRLTPVSISCRYFKASNSN